MKKRIFALAVVMICTSILASATLAYFTDTGIARNVITTGRIEAHVVEQQLEDGELVPYPSDPIPVMPGVTVSKIAMTQVAEGSAPAWIRMGYEVVIKDADKRIMPHTQAQLEELITIEPNQTHWIEQGGWYYYREAIEDGEVTEPLFREVKFSGPNMGNEYQNATIEILVVTQAVQQAHNGETVMEAQGWPED